MTESALPVHYTKKFEMKKTDKHWARVFIYATFY